MTWPSTTATGGAKTTTAMTVIDAPIAAAVAEVAGVAAVEVAVAAIVVVVAVVVVVAAFGIVRVGGVAGVRWSVPCLPHGSAATDAIASIGIPSSVDVPTETARSSFAR